MLGENAVKKKMIIQHGVNVKKMVFEGKRFAKLTEGSGEIRRGLQQTLSPVRVREKAKVEVELSDELPVAGFVISAHAKHHAVQCVVFILEIAEPAFCSGRWYP